MLPYIKMFSNCNTYDKMVAIRTERKMKMDDRFLTIKEVLNLSGVSRYTLYKDIKSGIIPTYVFMGSQRFKESDALKYAEKKKGSVFVQLWKNKKDTTQQKS